MMAVGGYLPSSHELGLLVTCGRTGAPERSEIKKSRSSSPLSSYASRQDVWSLHVSDQIYRPKHRVPCRYNAFICRSSAIPSSAHIIPLLKRTTLAFTRSCNALRESSLAIQLVPAVGIIAFAIWALGPLMHYSRNHLLHNDNNWKKSRIHHVFTSYFQPLLLWTGATLICRALNPVVLPSEASQAVKQRLLSFVQSLSTVLTVAYCLSSMTQQIQKFYMETSGADDTRNMGFQFAGRAIYTAVWVAAFSLFMELLGFSTQKWVTAGGLGTVLLTLAGREIFTNFLSSIMIHATRPFIVNEWIQTKIEGYEVSGTVEHVGWWSPTIIRGDDREAVHIPNHKFSVTVVRNLSQKTHWRIKTHLAISHLDVNKINNIVADMRKVLAKNPQIEQQRLHRRVFLENINPENQALRILISCFVKTSHFEEYLCVKEAVLLDLLRVISHHRARLATPIRTVQKVYGNADIENVPFSDTIFTRPGTSSNRPLLLIEPSSRNNGDDKAKPRPTHRANEEQTAKSTASESKVIATSDGTAQNILDKQQHKNFNNTVESQPKSSNAEPATESASSPSKSHQGLNTTGSRYNAGSGKPPLTKPVNEQSMSAAAASAPTNAENRSDRLPSPTPQVARPAFEDNIVLGVALGGSKRTLPIEEGMSPSPTSLETRELAASRSGNSSPPPSVKDKNSQMQAIPGAAAIDQRGQEREP